ncbi:MAG: amidohydrolase family protein, partial [Deltaproteobacteria bacterium]|nr:amidohydrolase family protein [Deltaproteobacteria bacterium]
AEAERLRKVWHKSASGRLRYAYAPYDVRCCSEELLIEVIGRARAAGCLLHVRAAESSTAVEGVRSQFSSDPIAHLHEVGLTGRDVVLAHCVWLTAREQKLLRESSTSVAHCPLADLRSAAGIAKIPELVAQGVRVSLGAGGAPYAGCLDLFETLRATALIHRVRATSSALTPYQLIEMATIRGAEALGLDQELGSLAVGKRADVVVVDLRGVHARPAGDALTALVYACRGCDVRHVLVDGQFAVRDGVLQTADLVAIHDEAERAATALRRRNG